MGLPAALGVLTPALGTCLPLPRTPSCGIRRGTREGQGVGLIHTMNLLNTVLSSYRCWGLAGGWRTGSAGSLSECTGAFLAFHSSSPHQLKLACLLFIGYLFIARPHTFIARVVDVRVNWNKDGISQNFRFFFEQSKLLCSLPPLKCCLC